MLFGILLPIYNKEKEVKTIKAMATGVDIYHDNKKPTMLSSRYQYVAILEIPKINLKQGLVAQTNEHNNINENIQIIDNSMFPDVINSNLILAAHNGNSKVSFFSNLNKLSKGDEIYLDYNNEKYRYMIDTIYDVLKTGVVNIIRDENKTAITLITCKNNDDSKQVVYIGYLIAKNIL